MANKKLGSVAPVVNTPTTVYTVPVGKSVVMNINVCNTGAGSAKVKISIGGDYVEYDTVIPTSGVLERTALIAEAGEVVSVTTDATGVVFRFYGIEE
jgi:hypothetical protein